MKTAKIKKKKDNERYWEGVGRRKTSTARVRLWSGAKNGFSVNNRKLEDYFPDSFFSNKATAPLDELNLSSKFRINACVKGGGFSGQAGAIRHGLARALTKFNPDFRKKLRKAGLLTRDSRMKERKKPGLKAARRAPQWKKR